jgi:hypothetical protein
LRRYEAHGFYIDDPKNGKVQLGKSDKAPLSKLVSVGRPATKDETEALSIKLKSLKQSEQKKWMPWVYVYFFSLVYMQTFYYRKVVMWNTGGSNAEQTRDEIAMEFAMALGLEEAQAKVITSPPVEESESETEITEDIHVIASPKPNRTATGTGMCVRAFSRLIRPFHSFLRPFR